MWLDFYSCKWDPTDLKLQIHTVVQHKSQINNSGNDLESLKNTHTYESLPETYTYLVQTTKRVWFVWEITCMAVIVSGGKNGVTHSVST